MRNRRLVLLSAAVSIAALTAAGCGSTSAAVRVGDDSVSRSDFESSLDFVYENEGMRVFLFQAEIPADRLRAEDAPAGVYTQDYVGALSGVHAQYLLADQIAGELGIEVTDETRDQVEAAIAEAVGGDIDDVPGAVRDLYIDGESALFVLQDAESDVVNAAADGLVNDVEVSSRYGSWDAEQFTVVPPDGPRPAPGSDTGTVLDGAELPAG